MLIIIIIGIVVAAGWAILYWLISRERASADRTPLTPDIERKLREIWDVAEWR